jgi:hypothetical protein
MLSTDEDPQFLFKGDGPLALAEREAAWRAEGERILASQPRVPDAVKALPLATHRLVDGRAVCDGGEGSKCHWYPACDEHEEWPCGCDYVAHAECRVLPWLNSYDLEDSAYDEALERRDPETLTFPDGEIEWEWEGEFVLWNYADNPDETGDAE